MTKKKKLAASLVSLVMAATITGTTLVASADVLKYGGKYYSDYDTHEEVVAAAEELNIQIAGEGMVLLKNENNALPLKRYETNVSVFGRRSDNLLLAGTGTGSVNAKTAPSLHKSLTEAGFNVNPALLGLYAKDSADKPDPKEEFSEFGRNVTDSYRMYNDAAIIVFSRVGGENADVSTDVGEAADEGEHIKGVKNKHYLEFTNAEQKLMEHVAANFKKVIVVLNASNPMELKELDQEKYGVSAAIWMSQPGQNGVMALGKILNGEVNPSGKLVDTFEKDFTSSIVWNNYGTGVQAVNNDGTAVYDEQTNPYPNLYRTEDGKIFGTAPKGNTPGTGFSEVQYEEGIYLGYKFYETMAYETEQREAGAGEKWWQDNMQYTFGHGLSYTTFTQKIKNVYAKGALGVKTPLNNVLAGNEGKIYVDVEVENTGKVAGKEVVQIYVNAPYVKGEVEKSYVQLVGFGKSPILNSGEKQTVTVEINVQDMASFDYNDANHNGKSTYELDAGDYKLFAMQNSHVKYAEYQFNIAEDVILENDDYSGNKVEALFSGEDEYNSLDYYGGFKEENLTMELVSRADFIDGTYTQPEAATAEELKRSEVWFNQAIQRDYYAVADDGNEDYTGYSSTPWTDETVPATWEQGKGIKDENGHYAIALSDMTGIDMNGTTALAATDTSVAAFVGKTGAQAWEMFMNQLTWEELVAAVSFGSHGTAAIPSIDKEQTRETDGPIALSGGFAWCVEPLQASTWNTVLTERLGILTANQALLRWQDSSYTNANMLAGWYGPAMNTHRSHFLGRTFEYYSEDGILGGYMGAAIVGGAQSKGLNCWIKHFVLNDQEIYRKGINTYATEQAIREIYCKPFQMAIQEGNATAIMTSFNRIGQVAAAVNYNLITRLAREEWEFDGVIVTDMYNSNCWPSAMLLRAGNDLPLGTVVPEGVWNAEHRGGKGSVDVTSVSVFNAETDYAANDYVSKGEYVSRKLVQKYYKFKKAYTSNGKILDLAEEAQKADGYVEEVKLEDIASDIKEQSDVQYYYVRLCAQRMLYTEANIMAAKNGYKLDNFANKTLAAVTQGTAVNQSLAVDMGAEVSSYELIKGQLPEGLILGADGTLSGTPVGKAGAFEFTVRAVYDRWIHAEATFTLTVNPAFTYTQGEAETGKAYVGAIDTETFAEEAKTYELKGALPEGLELNAESGEIVGTPVMPGTYEATIIVTVGSGNGAAKYEVPVSITVSGTAPKTEIELLAEKLAALETSLKGDLTEVKAELAALETSGKASADEIAALKAKIEALEKAQSGERGCNSSVEAIGIVGASFAVIAGAAVVMHAIRRSSKKED